MEQCEHKKLQNLYWRKGQKWMIIENFMICKDCEMVFRIDKKEIPKEKRGSKK